ncbi:hypothetical protein FRB99_002771 [Tulasnella sp. 403]|nr:hypothetical protein FRB99_002771 [Tulasnella sp. 403]
MERPQPNRNAFLSSPAPVFPSSGDTIFYTEPVSEDPREELRRRRSTRRKQTLAALLDELIALKDDDFDIDSHRNGPDAPGKLTNIRCAPIVDDRLQNEGAALFELFNKRIRQVDTELLNFGNAVRPLGSSVGLISSSFQLRARLQQILHLFRENASDIFPDRVKRELVEPLKPLSSRKKSKTRLSRQGPTRQIRPYTELTSDLEQFPAQFELLAKDLVTFLHFLHDIPEFRDEGLNTSVLSFDTDLKYWASCLKEFKQQFQYPAIKRYVNDLTREMDEHLENIRDALRIFVKDGVSTIRTAQNHTQTGLQNLSTVATFFSGVTATTLQYSFDKIDTSKEHFVNMLWITSLVFSIASSINSQLAYHWRAAMYRSPRSAVPWWVSIWLTRTPLIFLVVSVMAFSAGLVTWTYSSGQGRLVTTSATIFTSFTSMALLAVAIWFACERWAFSKTKGSRWLGDIANDMKNQFLRSTGLIWVAEVPPKHVKRAATWGGTQVNRVTTGLYKASTFMLGSVAPSVRRGSSSSGSFAEEGYAFRSNGEPVLPLNSSRSEHSRRPSDVSYKSHARLSPLQPAIIEDQEMVTSPTEEKMPIIAQSSRPVPETPGPVTAAKKSWQRIGKKVIQSRVMTRPSSKSDPTSPRSPMRQATMLSAPERAMSDGSERFAAVRPSRLTFLIPALKKLQATQQLNEHSGLVRHMQFSPDGKYLASCSWDRTAIIWRVGEPFALHQLLAHPGEGFIGQVAWSPDGTKLLTKMHRRVKVWTLQGVCSKTINREHKVEAVAWMPSGRAFASVEHDHVFILDTQGNVKGSHYFERMEIHDVAFTPDEQRLLLVGTLQKSTDGLIPSKSRAEKRILVYDLTDQTVENQVPVLENVRDVTISSDGQVALVSYEDKAPPELWRLGLVRDEGRLTLLRTYMPSVQTNPPPPNAPPQTGAPTNLVEFAGPSYFGGKGDQFIICASKKGDIHIWDRESGLLLHSLRGANIVDESTEDLTCIAWGHNISGQFMFATATYDGMVRIWTAPAPPETQPPSRAESPTPSARYKHPSGIGVELESVKM